VLVDASSGEEARRLAFVDAARDRGVPVRMLVCRSTPEIVQERLAARTRDASDADWRIYQRVERRWARIGAGTALVYDEVDPSAPIEAALVKAPAARARAGLYGPGRGYAFRTARLPPTRGSRPVRDA
jgi:predicted kinase